MKLDTIEIDRDEAKARLAEYEESLRHDRNSEDEAIARAYRSAARGLPVIRLSEAIHAGGYFGNGLPRLAIARADAIRCWVQFDWSQSRGRSSIIYRDEPDATNRGALVGKYTVRVDVPRDRSYDQGSTIVPIIPPRFRPSRWRIRGFHVLWEVEKWTLEPPRDPALVRHVGGDLWSVHAVWDLTELERAVLAGTR